MSFPNWHTSNEFTGNRPTSPSMSYPRPTSPSMSYPRPTSASMSYPRPTSPSMSYPRPTSPSMSYPRPTSTRVNSTPKTLIQGLKFLNHHSSSEPTVFSAFSLVSALMTLKLGANGQTLTEIDKYLGNMNYDMLISIVNTIISSGKVKVNNYLLVEQKFSMNADFLKTVKMTNVVSSFDKQNTQPAVRWINEITAKNTNGMITNLINVIHPSTAVIILNTLYFKDTWVNSFKEHNTKMLPFTGADKRKDLLTMQSYGDFHNYASLSNGNLLEMQYDSSDFAFGVYLPNLDSNCESVTADELFTGINSMLSYKITQLSLPKMDIESTHDLKKYLMATGIRSAFSSNASDLSRMSNIKPLFVSDVIQKARIVVDEKGTEAAAATYIPVLSFGVIPNFEMPKVRETTFIANRSFIHYIRYKPTNTFLFIGKFC